MSNITVYNLLNFMEFCRVQIAGIFERSPKFSDTSTHRDIFRQALSRLHLFSKLRFIPKSGKTT